MNAWNHSLSIPSRDVSGFEYFSKGEIGVAHSTAHQMLDTGRLEQGWRWLSQWLRGRTGHGSQWIHLQWHMLVFELALGYWDSAHERFLDIILPAATSSHEALTDAPAALWRLALARDEDVELPWNEVRATALDKLYDTDDAYVTLHNLLALAGAGDSSAIERWLSSFSPQTPAERTLKHLGRALRDYAAGRFASAARSFAGALPQLPTLGGSHAQNQLFVELYRRARTRSAANDNDLPEPVRLAH